MNIYVLLILTILLFPSHAVRADVLWRGGFETNDLSEWSGKLNAEKGARKNILVVDSPVHSGKYGAEITIHPDDLWPNNHNRVELHQDAKRTKEGQTTFFSWYFMLHADAQVHEDIGYWETTNSFQQSMAFYIDPSTTGTTLGFRTNRPSGKQHFKVPIATKTWHQIALAILWSTDAKVGKVSIWLDGQQVLDQAGAQTKPDGNDLFVQVGFHRDASAMAVESISIDDAVEGTSLDDVLMKAPPPAEAPFPASDAGMPNASGDPTSGAPDSGTSENGDEAEMTTDDAGDDAGRSGSAPDLEQTASPDDLDDRSESRATGCDATGSSFGVEGFGAIGLSLALARRRRIPNR